MDRLTRTLALVAIAASTCSCTDDVLDATYGTRKEAEASGAIERGWIPSWIPPQAINLHEAHNLDSSESVLAFSLPSDAAWAPPEFCIPAVAGNFYEPGFTRTWIPETQDNYRYFACREVKTSSAPLISALAISTDGKQVLFWRYLAP